MGFGIIQTKELRALVWHLGEKAFMNILGKRYYFFTGSLLIIIIGLVLLFANGVPLSIDFTGGSALEVSFADKSPQPSELIGVYEAANIKDVQVQTTEKGSYIIRSQFLENDQRDAIVSALN